MIETTISGGRLLRVQGGRKAAREIASRERVENWCEGGFRVLNETGYIKSSIKRIVSRYRTIMSLSRSESLICGVTESGHQSGAIKAGKIQPRNIRRYESRYAIKDRTRLEKYSDGTYNARQHVASCRTTVEVARIIISESCIL